MIFEYVGSIFDPYMYIKDLWFESLELARFRPTLTLDNQIGIYLKNARTVFNYDQYFSFWK